MSEVAIIDDKIPNTMRDSETLRTLNSFAIDLISIPNMEDLFWYVAQNVVGRLSFVDCVIYEANEEQTSLTQVAALGDKNPFGRRITNPLKISFGQGISGQAAQTRKSIIVDDLALEQSYIKDTKPARSEICVPIVCGNRVVGVIDSEHPDPNAFGAAELEVLTTIAAMTSAKLELLAEAERSNQRYHDLVAAHSQLSQEVMNRKALETELFNARKQDTVGRLTGKFAHEFNNLLTVILGNLEFLYEKTTDASVVEILQDAQNAANRGAEVIEAMLAYSQRTRLTPTPTDLNALIKTVVHDTQNTTLPIQLNIQGNISKINVDQKFLKLIVEQLIKNARDATQPGGIIDIQTEEVTLEAADMRPLVSDLHPGRYVRLNVCDNGEGIAPDNLHQIFDPFFTTRQVGAGKGLGLSMTLGYMLQSGGSIGMVSLLGKGSTLQLYFPPFTPEGHNLLTTPY